jgi:hypothetical protein
MKKTLMLVVFACLIASVAFAQDAATTTPAEQAAPAADEVVTINGTIIDNMCSGAQTPEGLAAFVETHTKECAVKPECAAAGYSIFANGTLEKFDVESNAKVANFLAQADSTLKVTVTAKKVNGELSLVSIANEQK